MPLPDPLITISPDLLSGEPAFTGTRVHVVTLFQYLAAGDPIEEFFADFPNVSREHAAAVLNLAHDRLIASLQPKARSQAAE